jgi:dTDP-4-dehydrorhamnose reductase
MFEGAALRLFVDEYRTPVRIERLVDGLFLALERSPGILHLGGGERISRYDFGLMVAEMHALKRARIVPCKQKDMDLGAPRPADVSLTIDKAGALGFHPKSLREELGTLLF